MHSKEFGHDGKPMSSNAASNHSKEHVHAVPEKVPLLVEERIEVY